MRTKSLYVILAGCIALFSQDMSPGAVEQDWQSLANAHFEAVRSCIISVLEQYPEADVLTRTPFTAVPLPGRSNARLFTAKFVVAATTRRLSAFESLVTALQDTLGAKACLGADLNVSDTRVELSTVDGYPEYEISQMLTLLPPDPVDLPQSEETVPADSLEARM